MTFKWQPENAEGSLWSATVTDGQQGWFEIQMEQSRLLGLGHQSRPLVLGPGEHYREGEDRSGGAARANGSGFSTVRDLPVHRK